MKYTKNTTLLMEHSLYRVNESSTLTHEMILIQADSSMRLLREKLKKLVGHAAIFIGPSVSLLEPRILDTNSSKARQGAIRYAQFIYSQYIIQKPFIKPLIIFLVQPDPAVPIYALLKSINYYRILILLPKGHKPLHETTFETQQNYFFYFNPVHHDTVKIPVGISSFYQILTQGHQAVVFKSRKPKHLTIPPLLPKALFHSFNQSALTPSSNIMDWLFKHILLLILTNNFSTRKSNFSFDSQLLAFICSHSEEKMVQTEMKSLIAYSLQETSMRANQTMVQKSISNDTFQVILHHMRNILNSYCFNQVRSTFNTVRLIYHYHYVNQGKSFMEQLGWCFQNKSLFSGSTQDFIFSVDIFLEYSDVFLGLLYSCYIRHCKILCIIFLNIMQENWQRNAEEHGAMKTVSSFLKKNHIEIAFFINLIFSAFEAHSHNNLLPVIIGFGGLLLNFSTLYKMKRNHNTTNNVFLLFMIGCSLGKLGVNNLLYTTEPSHSIDSTIVREGSLICPSPAPTPIFSTAKTITFWNTLITKPIPAPIPATFNELSMNPLPGPTPKPSA